MKLNLDKVRDAHEGLYDDIQDLRALLGALTQLPCFNDDMTSQYENAGRLIELCKERAEATRRHWDDLEQELIAVNAATLQTG